MLYDVTITLRANNVDAQSEDHARILALERITYRPDVELRDVKFRENPRAGDWVKYHRTATEIEYAKLFNAEDGTLMIRFGNDTEQVFDEAKRVR
jgi:hypothetical protein